MGWDDYSNLCFVQNIELRLDNGLENGLGGGGLSSSIRRDCLFRHRSLRSARSVRCPARTRRSGRTREHEPRSTEVESSEQIRNGKKPRNETLNPLVPEPTNNSPEDLEASLALPSCDVSEKELAQTILSTNRAPLMLAFVLTLLKHTMPSQPLSSRLSLKRIDSSAKPLRPARNTYKCRVLCLVDKG